MEKQPKSTAKVRFQDCDPNAHLNNSRYIDYMLNAREDHLKDFYDLDVYARMRTEKRGWEVAKNEILYKRPALLMEELVINSRLIAFSPRHIKVEIGMFNKQETELKALLWSVFVPFNAITQRADQHTDTIMKLIEEAHYPISEKLIEERATAIVESLGEV
ncbi:MAG: acyl-CoA thioesterase [Bacteroidetes bacterium]|nr:acyl-CoA thioesterase [Bacteroidota bacterium]